MSSTSKNGTSLRNIRMKCLHNEVILLVSLQDKVKTSIQKRLVNQDNRYYDKYNQ